jgi:hypothetical protein
MTTVENYFCNRFRLKSIFTENFKNFATKIGTNKTWDYAFNIPNVFKSDDGVVVQNNDGAILNSDPFTKVGPPPLFLFKYSISKNITVDDKAEGIAVNFKMSQQSNNITPVPPLFAPGVVNADTDIRLAESGVTIVDFSSGHFIEFDMCSKSIYIQYGTISATPNTDVFACAIPLLTKNNDINEAYDITILAFKDGSFEVYQNLPNAQTSQLIKINNVGVPTVDPKFILQKTSADGISCKFARSTLTNFSIVLGNYTPMNALTPNSDTTSTSALFNAGTPLYLGRDGINNNLIPALYQDVSLDTSKTNYGQGSLSKYYSLVVSNIYS